MHQKGPALQVGYGWLDGSWARLTASGKPGQVHTVVLRRLKVRVFIWILAGGSRKRSPEAVDVFLTA